jgi:hypothetical protein
MASLAFVFPQVVPSGFVLTCGSSTAATRRKFSPMACKSPCGAGCWSLNLPRLFRLFWGKFVHLFSVAMRNLLF